MNGVIKREFWRNEGIKFLALLCCIVVGYASPPPKKLTKKISAKDAPRIHKLLLPELGDNGVGWEITLKIDDPRALDLDLEVYADNPKGRFIKPICLSDMLGSVERCRINADQFPAKRAWVKVFVGSGYGRTRYSYAASTLEGPVIQGTDFYGGDALKIPLLPDSERENVFGMASPASQHLYRIKIPPDTKMQRLNVWVIAKDGKTNLLLIIYNSQGYPVARTKKQASDQFLTFEAQESEEFFALVKLETLRSIRGKKVDYHIEVRGIKEIIKEQLNLAIALDKAELLFPERKPVPIYDPEAYFELRVSSKDFFCVVLDGKDFDLTVYVDPRDTYFKGDRIKIYHGRSATEGVQFVTFGDPLNGSEHLISRLKEKHSYLIHVTRNPENYFGKAILNVKSYLELGSFPFVFRFFPEEPNKKLDPRKPPTNVEKVEPEKLFVYELTPFEGYFTAALEEKGGLSERFDIAVCGMYGEVFDIEDNRVTFHHGMLEKANRLFLVVFPWPSDPKDVGGEFKVIINESKMEK